MKTVDGGIAELSKITAEKRKEKDPTSRMKFEMLEKDLQLVRMQLSMYISEAKEKEKKNAEKEKEKKNDENLQLMKREKILKKVGNQMMEGKDDVMYSTNRPVEDYEMHDPEIRKAFRQDTALKCTMIEASLKSRKKFVDHFYCKKKYCGDCRESSMRNSTTLPCTMKPDDECFEGVMVKYAFLTCVRSAEPQERESAMTTFRQFINIDDSKEGSDIMKMIDIDPREMQQKIKSNSNSEVVTMLSRLTSLAVVSVMKAGEESDLEALGNRMLNYYVKTDCSADDLYVWNTFYDADGFYGYINWFAKFLLLSLQQENYPLLRAEMFIFLLEICPPLVELATYGLGDYPWLESTLYNFNKIFKNIWVESYDQWGKKGVSNLTLPTPTSKNKKILSISQSLITRNTEEFCGCCKKKFPKSSKLFPVCFQATLCIDKFPKEIARMERKEVEENVSLCNLKNDTKNILVVCSTKCVLESMSQMNPKLNLLSKGLSVFMNNKHVSKTWLEKIVPSTKSQLIEEWSYLTGEERIRSLQVCVRFLLERVKEDLKYFSKSG